MIDLHMHTTASDGRSTPEELVAEVASKGIRIMAVTDHDTLAGVAACQAAARDAGVTCHVGIEITSVDHGRDVHMLGYGVDPAHVELDAFLTRQRLDRRRRLEEIGTRLAQLGVPVDLERAMVDAGRQVGRAMGRPMAAAALIAAGHVADIREAFDRYLGEGKPAFIERIGPSPADVATLIGRAGGVASLAHPGKSQRDHLIAGLADAGLPAIEVYHPDHDPIDTARYKQMARSLGLLMTGGSDYHGVGSTREPAFGRVHLPSADYARLAERLGWAVIHAH
jgi:predicted metal-dependent phosphoesterase TrpH